MRESRNTFRQGRGYVRLLVWQVFLALFCGYRSCFRWEVGSFGQILRFSLRLQAWCHIWGWIWSLYLVLTKDHRFCHSFSPIFIQSAILHSDLDYYSPPVASCKSCQDSKGLLHFPHPKVTQHSRHDLSTRSSWNYLWSYCLSAADTWEISSLSIKLFFDRPFIHWRESWEISRTWTSLLHFRIVFMPISRV